MSELCSINSQNGRQVLICVHSTGITGYIGGDAFYAVHTAHPDYEYSALVRNEDKGKLVKEKYPHVRLVYGSNTDEEIIAKEAAWADIVIRTKISFPPSYTTPTSSLTLDHSTDTAGSADDIPSAKAISKGLQAHDSSRPGYWLHICGTGLLIFGDEDAHRYGQPPLPDQTFSDVDGIERLLTLPDHAFHRDVDKIVLATNTTTAGAKTAILGPPTIYGPGRGPGNQRSHQAYELTRLCLENGWAMEVETGETRWDSVHVHDLSAFFVTLVDAAVSGKYADNPDVFGDHAYYFLENGKSHSWGELARWIAEEAKRQGFIEKAEVRSLSNEEQLKRGGNRTFAANSSAKAQRAKKYFGWEPKGRHLKDEVPDIVAGEAKKLGITPKYA